MNPSSDEKRLPLAASPKYPWRSYSPLRTHDFVAGPFPRSARRVRVFICRSCGRRFQFDEDARTTRAVGRDGCSPLQSAVNIRWLSEPCAGRRRASDAEDFKRVKASHGR
ncbi:MAG: hypothetical protein HYY35_07390 [Deltaproteobacteria bacterium]|nr:hypothetical protein [Deltaproteobacteria bacterium]